MLKLEKSVLIKLLIIVAVFFIAPHAVPLSMEFVLMADIMGLEAFLLFLLYQFRHVFAALVAKFTAWQNHIAATTLFLASVYAFQPRIFFSHVVGSSFILLLACSMTMAFALWIPAIYLSSSGFV